MPSLHDPAYRESVKARIRSLAPSAAPRWGRMSLDQMLWHVGSTLELCMGRLDASQERLDFPLPKPLLRFIVLAMPWPKGAPTAKVTTAAGPYNLEEQRARCLQLIDEFAALPLNAPWPNHPAFGRMSGDQYSRLQAKHLNHHLTQFGA